MQITDQLEFEHKRKLVDALLSCDCMKLKEGRDKVIGELRQDIRDRIERHSENLQDALSILETCLKFLGGFDELIERIAFFDRGKAGLHELIVTSHRINVTVNFALTEHDLERLKEILDGATPGIADIESGYKSSIPTAAFIPAEIPRDSWQAFLSLFEFGAFPPIRFLEQIKGHIADQSVKTMLTGWIASSAGKLEVNAQLNEFRNGMVTGGSVTVYLLVQLNPTAPGADRFVLTAWRWTEDDGFEPLGTNDVPVELPDVEKHVSQWISETDDRYDNPEIHLELIAPHDQFCIDLSDWKVDVGEMTGSLLKQHPVVIRWLSRFINFRRHRNRWMSKWLAVQNCDSVRKDREFLWIDRPDAMGQQTIIDALRDPSCGICIGLNYAPKPKVDLQKDPLIGALNAGTPIAIWLNRNTEGSILDDDGLLDLINMDALIEVPKSIWRRRISADDSNPVPDELMILYDDFFRVPPPPASVAPAVG